MTQRRTSGEITYDYYMLAHTLIEAHIIARNHPKKMISEFSDQFRMLYLLLHAWIITLEG